MHAHKNIQSRWISIQPKQSNLWTIKAGKNPCHSSNKLYLQNFKNGENVEHEEFILTWTS